MIRTLFSAAKNGLKSVISLLLNVWKCKIIFPTDTLQQKIETTDLKLFLAAENTSAVIILASAVFHVHI